MVEMNQLVQDLESGELTRQRDAAEKLLNAEDAPLAAAALVKAVGCEDEILVEAATGTLESIESISAEQAALLSDLLPDKEHPQHLNTGYWAATLLGRLGASAGPYVGRLLSALDASEHAAVKQRIVWALGEIGPAADSASVQLNLLLNSQDQRLARLAEQALDSIKA